MAKFIPPAQSPSSEYTKPQESALGLNSNVVIIAVLICAVICTLGLMLHCILECTNRALREHVEWIKSRIVNSGLRKRDVMALPTSVYGGLGSSSLSITSCAICLMDFSDGDQIRVLPKCNHGFHVACIDKWLLANSSCPTCRLRLNFSSIL